MLRVVSDIEVPECRLNRESPLLQSRATASPPECGLATRSAPFLRQQNPRSSRPGYADGGQAGCCLAGATPREGKT